MTQEDAGPVCPVHPFGYHARPRVRARGSRHVFRDSTWVGFPQRCPALEMELEDADREGDLVDELWLRERSSSSTAVLTVLATFSGALMGVVLTVIYGDVTDVTPGLVWLAVAILAGVGIATGLVARRRDQVLRRIRDWQRRVGSPR